MKTRAVINIDSGSTPANAEQVLATALHEKGVTAQIHQCGGDELVDCLEQAMDCDRLIVWGGDGTVACALYTAGPSGPAILPLPGGTMNLLHKQVHGGTKDWREALEALDRETLIDLPAGEIDGRRFYVAAMFGRLTQLAEPREALREGDLVGAARALIDSDALDLQTALIADWGASDIKATALGTFVQADCLDIAAIDPNNHAELVETGLWAALSDWREASGVAFHQTQRISVQTIGQDKLLATLDGEPYETSADAVIRHIPNAATVLSAQS